MSHPKTLDFYKSILNTMLGYDPVGWGLPLGSMFPDVDRQSLIEGIGDIIAMVIDYRPEPDAGAAIPPTNAFADWCATLEVEEDIDFIIKGMSQMLNYPLINPSTSHPAVHHRESQNHSPVLRGLRPLSTGSQAASPGPRSCPGALPALWYVCSCTAVLFGVRS